MRLPSGENAQHETSPACPLSGALEDAVLPDEPAHGRRHGPRAPRNALRDEDRVGRGRQPQDEREDWQLGQFKDAEGRRGAVCAAAKPAGVHAGRAGSGRARARAALSRQRRTGASAARAREPTLKFPVLNFSTEGVYPAN
jgi:hypothetical protein